METYNLHLIINNWIYALNSSKGRWPSVRPGCHWWMCGGHPKANCFNGAKWLGLPMVGSDALCAAIRLGKGIWGTKGGTDGLTDSLRYGQTDGLRDRRMDWGTDWLRVGGTDRQTGGPREGRTWAGCSDAWAHSGHRHSWPASRNTCGRCAQGCLRLSVKFDRAYEFLK